MTELTEAIRNYLPSDDREAADKVAFLQFLEAFGETSYDRENLVGHVTATAWGSRVPYIACKIRGVLAGVFIIYIGFGLCRADMPTVKGI